MAKNSLFSLVLGKEIDLIGSIDDARRHMNNRFFAPKVKTNAEEVIGTIKEELQVGPR